MIILYTIDTLGKILVKLVKKDGIWGMGYIRNVNI